MFTGAFLVLGADGVRPHHHVNESVFWTDFLAMIGAFGLCISSALTIVVRYQLFEVVAPSAHRSDATPPDLLPQVRSYRIHDYQVETNGHLHRCRTNYGVEARATAVHHLNRVIDVPRKIEGIGVRR